MVDDDDEAATTAPVPVVRAVPEVMPAELRMNDDYVFYYNNLAKLVITGIIPFVSLCFFNFKIYSSLRRRRSVMGPAACAAHQQQLNEDNRQALVLFSIVIIFLVTNTPRILINIDEVYALLFHCTTALGQRGFIMQKSPSACNSCKK